MNFTERMGIIVPQADITMMNQEVYLKIFNSHIYNIFRNFP